MLDEQVNRGCHQKVVQENPTHLLRSFEGGAESAGKMGENLILEQHAEGRAEFINPPEMVGVSDRIETLRGK